MLDSARNDQAILSLRRASSSYIPGLNGRSAPREAEPDESHSDRKLTRVETITGRHQEPANAQFRSPTTAFELWTADVKSWYPTARCAGSELLGVMSRS